MAARVPGALNSVAPLGPLGMIVACLQPHARLLLKQTVKMAVAASISRKDHRLLFRAIERAFAEIEAKGARAISKRAAEILDGEAWLKRQLDGLDSGGR